MKTRTQIVLFLIVVALGSVVTFVMIDVYQGQIEWHEKVGGLRDAHYEIEIIGLKDIYFVGEQYDFSYIISGYGYQCGSKKISFPDENGNYTKIISSSSCIADVPMEEFVFDIQKEHGTTFGHITLNNPGTYTITVTFDRPNQYFPTTVSKEFRVVEK